MLMNESKSLKFVYIYILVFCAESIDCVSDI